MLVVCSTRVYVRVRGKREQKRHSQSGVSEGGVVAVGKGTGRGVGGWGSE